jgi:hypothetical protein
MNSQKIKSPQQMQIKSHLMNACMNTLGIKPYEHVYEHIGHHRYLQFRKQAKDEIITTDINKILPYERVYEHIGHKAL